VIASLAFSVMVVGVIMAMVMFMAMVVGVIMMLVAVGRGV
jgi:hypothetical protein